MVKTQNLVPEIYYKESRDFQYFGRLFDIIFNYCKTNIELSKSLYTKVNSELIDLIVQTLGFKPEYNNKIVSLTQLALIWSNIIKNKGNINSIKTIINGLLNFENSSKSSDITFTPIGTESNCNVINISIPNDITQDELYLIEKILDYVLPVTTVYQIHVMDVQNISAGYIIHNDYAEINTILKQDRLADDISTAIARKKINESSETSIGSITDNEAGDLRVSTVARD